MIAHLQEWQNFYMLAGTAAATLVGLMFVAISLSATFNAPADLNLESRVRGLSAFMSPTFIHFVYVLGISAVVFVPTLSDKVLGGLLLLAGLGSLVNTARDLAFVLELHRNRRIDPSDWFWYRLMPAVAYVLLCDAGINVLTAGLHTRRPHALDALAAASILLMVMGVRNAWDLVVWMVLRSTGGSADGPARRPPSQPPRP